MGIEAQIKQLAEEDSHLSREMHWRNYGYRLEVSERLNERFGLDVSPGDVTEAVGNIDSRFLIDNGEFGIDNMESSIREEFKRGST